MDVQVIMVPIFYVVYRHIKTLGMVPQGLVEPYYMSVVIQPIGCWSIPDGYGGQAVEF